MKRIKVLSILLLFLNFCLRRVGHDWSENPFLLLESVLLSLPSCDSSTAFFLSSPCLWDAISCPWIWHRLPKIPVQTPLILLRDSPPHQMTVFAALVSVPSKCPHHKATTLNCKWLIISAKLKLSGLSQPGDFITLHSLQGGPSQVKVEVNNRAGRYWLGPQLGMLSIRTKNFTSWRCCFTKTYRKC